jgi:hypothetical protein
LIFYIYVVFFATHSAIPEVFPPCEKQMAVDAAAYAGLEGIHVLGGDLIKEVKKTGLTGPI